MLDDVFSDLFYLVHKSGDHLYPKMIKNLDTGVTAFRVSSGGAGGNTKSVSIEVMSEVEMKKYVLDLGYAIRAATLDGKRHGQYKIEQRSIVRVVKK